MSIRRLLADIHLKNMSQVATAEPEFKSTHGLAFEIKPYDPETDFDPDYTRFRVGTCTGAYGCTHRCYTILVVKNSAPGNGHLDDVFEWFENSCRRDKRDLVVLEVMNKRFKRHLIEKRGFSPFEKDHVIKKISIIPHL